MKRRAPWLPNAVVIAVAGVVVGVEAARDPVRLWALSAILVLNLAIALWLRGRRDQGWAGGYWPHVVVLALLARILAGCAHMFVAYVVLGGELDFIGLQSWVGVAAHNVLRGVFEHPAITGFFFFAEESAVAYVLAPFYFVVGPSILGMIFLSGLIGFLGSFLFLRAFQLAGPVDGDVRFFGSMIFFLPTLVFWASLFGKDSVMFFCLGVVSYGFARVVRGEAGVAVVLSSIVCLALATFIRSHMAIPAMLALGVAWVLRPLTLQGPARVLRPFQAFARPALVCLIVAVPVWLVFGTFGGPGMIVESMVIRHNVMSKESQAVVPGFSSSLPPKISGESPWEFVAFLPEGYLTALYRPLPFDAHNAQAAVAAIEGTVMLLITVWRRRQFLGAFRAARSNPFMMFCVTYFLVGTWVLSFHRNLGILARQRAMVIPFLVMMLAVSVRRRAPRVVRSIDSGSMSPRETRA